MASVADRREIETGLKLHFLEGAEKQLVRQGLPDVYAMLVAANPARVADIPKDILYLVIAKHVPIKGYEIVPHKSCFYVIPTECISEDTDPRELIGKLELGKSIDLGFTTLYIAIGFKEVPEEPWESLERLADVLYYKEDIARRPRFGSAPFDVRRPLKPY